MVVKGPSSSASVAASFGGGLLATAAGTTVERLGRWLQMTQSCSGVGWGC